MVCIGLDVGREKHDYVVMGQGREPFLDGTFPNESWAFSAWCEHVESVCGTTEIRLAYETANGLATPLDQFLVDRGWELVTIQPSAVKSYRQNVLRKHDKTDWSDAWTLAHLGLQWKVPEASEQPRRALRTLTRWRESLVRSQTRTVNRLRQTTAAYWPELTSSKLITNYGALYIIALFEHFPDPKILSEISPSEVMERFRHSGSRIPANRLLLLQRLARQNSVYPREKEQLVMAARLLARKLGSLVQDIAEVDRLLEKLGRDDAIVKFLLSWSGVGIVTATTYASEIQSIDNFESESSLASYSGLALRKVQTGKSKDYKTPQRSANRRLKRCLAQMANGRRLYDQESARYYDRKRAEGKTHLQATRCLARHITRRIFKSLKSRQA
jgi:transposase